jgi:DNA-binding NtrC family response regulator
LGRFICVCEDDAFVRQLAVEILTDEGFDVVDFRCGDHAVAHLSDHAPKFIMIFTDVQMPGEWDGVRLVLHAAEHWPWLKLLVTSGAVTPGGLPAHAKFLRKPWRYADLVAHAHS